MCLGYNAQSMGFSMLLAHFSAVVLALATQAAVAAMPAVCCCHRRARWFSAWETILSRWSSCQHTCKPWPLRAVCPSLLRNQSVAMAALEMVMVAPVAACLDALDACRCNNQERGMLRQLSMPCLRI